MKLIEMSVSVSIFITTVLFIRGCGKGKISKSVIVLLWDFIIIRALVPFQMKLTYTPVPSAEKAESIKRFSDIQKGIENTVVYRQYQQQIRYPIEEAAQAIQTWNWKYTFTSIWVLGTFLFMLYFVNVYRKEHQRLKNSVPIHSELVDRMLQIRPVHRKIQVYQSELFLTPVTYGILHPKIVLPVRLSELSRVDMRNMIVHELVHIHRWDVAKRFFLIAVLCIHWFNPLVWVMFWLYQQDQEISCDEQVLKRMDGQRSKNYIYTMIKMSSKGEKFLAVHGFGGKSFGKKRILAAMGRKHKRGVQTLAVLLPGALLALSFVSFIPVTQSEYLNQDKMLKEKTVVLAAEEQGSVQQLSPDFEEMIVNAPVIPDEDFDFLAIMRDIEENVDLDEPLTDRQRIASNIKCYITIAELCKEKQDKGITLTAEEVWLIDEYYDFVRKNYEMDEEREKEYQHWREAWMADIVL